jgi:hypothetical protein
LILGNTLSNIQVSNISGFVSGNTLSNLNASNLSFGVVDSSLVYGNTLSNIAGSNVTGNVANATVALVVSQASQPNITSVGTLSDLNVQGLLVALNGSGISNMNAGNVVLGTLSTNVFPGTGVVPGAYGSAANVAQVTVDQYGRVTAAANVSFTPVSQWTTVNGNVAYQNGVSIGTISDPPNGSNLYVLGTANVTTLNVTTLFANTATIFGSSTLNVLGTSNLNLVLGQLYVGNGSGLSNLNASNISLGVLDSRFIYGNTLSNIAGSNVTGNVANATVALVVSQASQPNITSVGTLTNLVVSNSLTTSNVAVTGNLEVQGTANIWVANIANIYTTNIIGFIGSQWTTGTGNVYYIGGVGIGTSTVSANLSVQGNIYASNALSTTNAHLTGALNVQGVSNLWNANVANVYALRYFGDGGLLSNITNFVQPVANLVVSNAVTTTNMFANTLTLANATASITGNLYVSNALSTTNAHLTGALNVQGVSNLANVYALRYFGDGGLLTNISSSAITQPFANLVVSNSVTTTNLYTAGISSNASNTIFNYSTLTVPFILATTLNVFSTANILTQTIQGSIGATSLDVTGNLYASNALSTTNAYLSGALNVQGVSNLVNVYALRYFGDGGLLSNITNFVQPVANLMVSNAVTTTNLFANTLTLANATSTINVLGSVTATTFYGALAGANTGAFSNLYSANALTTTNLFANTLTLANATSTINVLGSVTATTFYGALAGANTGAFSNLYSTNALSTTNLFANTLTLANATSTINVIGTVAASTFYGALAGANTGAFSNLYSANALSTTNLFANTLTLANATSTINVLGSVTATTFYGALAGANTGAFSNLYSANALATTNLFANTLTLANAASTINVIGTVVASTFYGALAGANTGAFSNLYSANALTTTNLFANTLTLANAASTINVIGTVVASTFYGALAGANTGAFSNLYSANALTTTNLFANTMTLANATASITGNLYVSNAVTTTNLYTAGLSSNASDTIFNSDTLVVPFISATTLNVFSTANILTQTIQGSTGATSLNVTGNLYVSNALSTTNAYLSGALNVQGVSNLANVYALRYFGDGGLLSNITNFVQPVANLVVSNAVTATNLFANTLTLANATSTINVLGSVTATTFYGAHAGANTGAFSNLYSANALTTTNLFANTLTLANAASTINVLGSVTATTFYGALAGSNTGAFSNIYSANALTTTNVFATTANVGTLNVFQISNLNSLVLTNNLYAANALSTTNVYLTGALNVQGVSNLWNANVANIYALRYFGDGGLLTNISSSAITQPFANLVVSNAVTTTNIFATTANVNTLNVASLETTGNLSISGNVIPVTGGNTYVLGNLVVAGNVFSSLGVPLGSGGGYYLSLPGDIAIQTGYNGPIYGTAYPLSIGLSNGFTISGTSTLITITSNGNLKFNTAGPYILNAVFNSSDNITGLAVGSNVADIHGQDQNYLYRYTTFVSQNPTEVIEIPINVTDATKYYYLDLFKVDAGVLHQTTDPRGGTWLTIAPLTGGGLATGGPGGTPGTQWISSGPNIYFPNSVGIGAVNPAYNLDVTTGTTGTQRLVTSNISSLGLYGPLLNISSNVLIQSNLAVGGGSVPNESPPYALYVTGQGYFSNHVSYQNFAGYRNRIVNGTFRVAARANTITVSNTSIFSYSNTWVMDRWRVDVGGLATSNVSFNVKQDVPIGTTNGFTQCANVFVIRGLTGTTGNTWVCPLSQTIEASFIFDFRWGQPTAKPAVFSFYANTSVSGDYSVVFRSRQDNTYYANLVSITAGTWLQHVIYLPPCYIGNWAQASTDGYVDVLIGGVSYGVNSSNNHAVAVTSGWTANPGFAPVSCIGATTWPATTGLVLQITGPQLEEGTIATPFEIRPLTQTYIYCQRFYETNQQTQYAAALGSGRVNSIPFVTTKRNNPNVSVYTTQSNLVANTNISRFTSITGSGTYANSAVTSYTSSQYGFTFNFAQPGGGYNTTINEAQFVWQADSEIY